MVPLTAGTRVALYDIIRLLVAAGIGIVYEAQDTDLDRDLKPANIVITARAR